MNKIPRILIVEDDAIIAADLSASLTSTGYEIVGPLSSGEEVLEQITSLRPDLILMDINLRGTLDGIQTAEAVQETIPTPVVFLTGLSDEDTLRRARLAHPFGYLLKPFDISELRANIAITLDRNRERTAAASVAQAEESVKRTGDALEMQAGIDQKSAFLSQIPEFASLTPDALRSFAEASTVVFASTGEFLFVEGSPTPAGFIPITGRLGFTKTSAPGKELIVALIGPGDPFCLTCLHDSFSGVLSVKAQSDSRLLKIAPAVWKQILKDFPSLSQSFLALSLSRLRGAFTLASSIAHARVEGRIVHSLLTLIQEFGKPGIKGPDDGRIFMTRKELAELTGTTPETAIRVTKNLEREGMLDLTRPGIIKIPSISKLKSYASRLN